MRRAASNHHTGSIRSEAVLMVMRHTRHVHTTSASIKQFVMAALLVVGVISMHHLVVTACHQVVNHVSHGVMAESHSPESAMTDSASIDSSFTSEHTQAGGPVETSDLTNLLMTCLAILVLVLSAVRPRNAFHTTTQPRLPRRAIDAPRTRHALDPPDLRELSISRT